MGVKLPKIRFAHVRFQWAFFGDLTIPCDHSDVKFQLYTIFFCVKPINDWTIPTCNKKMKYTIKC